jgi:hypothetical protein
MKRILFTKETVYETEGVGRGPTFKAGSVYDLRDDLADRWLRREVAVLAPEPEPDAASTPPAVPEPARAVAAPDAGRNNRRPRA